MFVVRLAVSRARAKPAQKRCEIAKAFVGQCGEKIGDDNYRVTMAIAGFGVTDIEITQTNNSLVVKAEQGKADAETEYLHRGIATRAFERQFDLADHVNVTTADLVNGLLVIDLKRKVPEEFKPRKIEITASRDPRNIGHDCEAA